jgi:hypothetical protein
LVRLWIKSGNKRLFQRASNAPYDAYSDADAVYDAADDADGVAAEVRDTAYAAADIAAAAAVAVVAAKTNDAWSAIHSDCEVLAAAGDLFSQPLWHEVPGEVADGWLDARTWMQQNGWQFWFDWYERALAGEPQPWPLLLEIAIQKNDFWEEGTDEDVMSRIDEIVAQYEDPSLAQIRGLISQQTSTNLGSEAELAARNRVQT